MLAPAFTRGVEGWSFFKQYCEDRVEGKAGGVGAYLLQYGLGAELFQHQDGGEHLRDGFDTELVVGIAYVEGGAVGERYTDAEEIRVDVGKERDVVGVVSAGDVLALIVGLLDGLLDLGVGNFLFHKYSCLCVLDFRIRVA